MVAIQARSDEEIVEETIHLFSQMQLTKYTFAQQCEEIASLIWPEVRNTFQFGSQRWPGQKLTQRQVDATGMAALSRFSAICDSLLTPRNMTWHGLEPAQLELRKDRDTSLWFEEATRQLFHWRYAPHSNFGGQNHNNYMNLGAFGTHCLFADRFANPTGAGGIGIRYRSIPLGELFILENHQGLVTQVIRWFRLTAKQAMQQWGKERFPEQLKTALEQNSPVLFDFLHHVCPRNDYDPGRLDYRGKPWASYYVCLAGRCLMSQGGYTSFPYAVGRYTQAPGEVFGRSPAMSVLPSLKTLNDQKAVFLKTGHRAADPVLLTSDDGLVDMVDLTPGAINKGGVSSDGKPLIQVLPVGSVAINEKMMEIEAGIINDAFLVSLFQILTESPQMTATEVIERVNEKGILLAPTVGRQQSEYLGPLIEREIDLLVTQGLLPPMPAALKEAGGEYRVVYTSPLSLAMRAQEAAGFARTLESALTIVNATGDPSYLDIFDMETALRGIATIQAVPPSWLANKDMIEQRKKARAAAMERQQQIQAAPAQAAMMKAQAVQAKAGMGGPQQQQQAQQQQGQGQQGPGGF